MLTFGKRQGSMWTLVSKSDMVDTNQFILTTFQTGQGFHFVTRTPKSFVFEELYCFFLGAMFLWLTMQRLCALIW